MRASIAAPFADSRTADLRLAYGMQRLPALGIHSVVLAGAHLELRVLGASHQVVVDLDGATWSETVACLAGHDTHPRALPESDEQRAGGLRSRFVSRCVRLEPVAFAARVHAVRQWCDGRSDALVGTFPGSPLAVTALLVAPATAGRAGWRTWHAYPQTGELVETTSLVDTTTVVGPV